MHGSKFEVRNLKIAIGDFFVCENCFKFPPILNKRRYLPYVHLLKLYNES